MVWLERNTIAWGEQETSVRPRTAELVHMLVEAAPHSVHVDRLISRVLGVDHPSEEPLRLIYQHIRNARVSLMALGWKVTNSRMRGYFLERRTE